MMKNLFLILVVSVPLALSKCSDSSKAGNCMACLSDPNCRYCPGRISETRTSCLHGECERVLERKCVQKLEKYGRVCHGFWWLMDQPQCGHETKYRRDDVVEDEKFVLRTEKGPVKAEHVLAVGSRVLKSGFIVTALLHAVGVSALAGPAAPFLLAAGAVAFLSYDVMEKIHQKSLKKQYESLMEAAQDFMYALEGNTKKRSESGGLVLALHEMINVIKGIPTINARVKQIEDQLHKLKMLEKQAKEHSHSEASRKQIEDMLRQTEALEPLLGQLKRKLKEENEKIRVQRTRVKALIQSTSEITNQVICTAKEIGHRIFGEKFDKVLGVWSKVLAAVSVCVVGVDGIMNGAEMAADVAEGGLETATVLGGDLPTAAIHIAEIREFFEHEDEDDVRVRVRRILCELENRQAARGMEDMVMDSLYGANEFVVPGARRRRVPRSHRDESSHDDVCLDVEEGSTKTRGGSTKSDEPELERAFRVSEDSFSRLTSHLSCASEAFPRDDSSVSSSVSSHHDSPTLRGVGEDFSSSLQPPNLPVVSSDKVGDFEKGQSKIVEYRSGARSVLKRRNVPSE
eukprot:g3229.t1